MTPSHTNLCSGSRLLLFVCGIVSKCQLSTDIRYPNHQKGGRGIERLDARPGLIGGHLLMLQGAGDRMAGLDEPFLDGLGLGTKDSLPGLSCLMALVRGSLPSLARWSALLFSSAFQAVDKREGKGESGKGGGPGAGPGGVETETRVQGGRNRGERGRNRENVREGGK